MLPTSTSASRRGVLAGALGAAVVGHGRRATAAPSNPGALTVGSALDIVNFDPYAQTVNSLLLLKTVNAWLIDYDERLRPVPSALQGFTIAPDRTAATLRIRSDVVFHTGKTMTVDDVVAAFERALDPKRGFNIYAATSSILSGVKAVGATEVALQFKQPTATSLITDLLAGQPVLDKDRNDSGFLTKEGASAGPYQVAEWRQGESLVLEAFPKWFGGTPRTKRVTFRFYTSPSAAVNALASGAIDVFAYPTPRDASRLRSGFDVVTGYPGAATMLLRVSTKTAPFDDRALRQALQRAINRERIVRDVLFGFGGAAFLPWGTNSPANELAVQKELAFDLDAARGLLAGYRGPKQGSAMVSGADPTSLLVTQIIQADLASIGFDLRIEQVDTATFASRLPAGEFGVALGQVGGGQLSVPRIVQNSLMRTTANPLWPGGNPPKAYAEGIDALVGAEDVGTRQAAIARVNRALVEEAWAIGVYDVPTLFAHKKDLRGLARDHQNALVLSAATF